MNHIKITSQKTIITTKHFDVKENKLELPNKKNLIHHDVYKSPAVFVFPLSKTYELYLIRQYRYLLEKEIISVIAGFIDSGETSIAAAKRELKEEGGLGAEQIEELLRLDIAGSVLKSTSHLFLAKELLEGEPALEEDEEISLFKIPLSEAVKKVLSGEITEITTVAGILLLEELRREKKL